MLFVILYRDKKFRGLELELREGVVMSSDCNMLVDLKITAIVKLQAKS